MYLFTVWLSSQAKKKLTERDIYWLKCLVCLFFSLQFKMQNESNAIIFFFLFKVFMRKLWERKKQMIIRIGKINYNCYEGLSLSQFFDRNLTNSISNWTHLFHFMEMFYFPLKREKKILCIFVQVSSFNEFANFKRRQNYLRRLMTLATTNTTYEGKFVG